MPNNSSNKNIKTYNLLELKIEICSTKPLSLVAIGTQKFPPSPGRSRKVLS